MPVRVKKTRQNRNLEFFHVSTKREKAPAHGGFSPCAIIPCYAALMNSKVKQRHAKGIYGPLSLHLAAGAEALAAVQVKSQPLATPASGQRSITVEPEHNGVRIDKFLAANAAAAGEALSRTRLQALIEAGQVSIDGKPAADTGAKLRTGQVVTVDVPEAIAPEPKGEVIPLAIVFEDEHLIVINKPAGLVVHPAAGHQTGTLVNALIAHCGETLSGIGGVKRPGIVHRLEKDTSGLLVVAKTDAAHLGLSELFADHGRTLNLTREYQAILWGAPTRMQGKVDAPLGRHPQQRERQAVVHGEKGREAITHWQVKESFTGVEKMKLAVLVRCALETGRTHQIRVHMAHLGHPVMGDRVYASGYKTKAARLNERSRAAYDALGRQALHAAVLGFTHPVTGEELMFESTLPDDMAQLVAALRG